MPPELLSSLPTILFLLAVVAYWIGAFIILYHLIRFGIGNRPKIIALIFFIGSIVILGCIASIFFTSNVVHLFN